MNDNSAVAIPTEGDIVPAGLVSASRKNTVEILMQDVAAMDYAAKYARGMCRTSAVPDIYRIGSKPNSDKDDDEVIGNAAAAILYGMDLELSATQALQNVFSVGGKPAIYARTAAALLDRKGYRTWTESTSDEAVTVMGTNPAGTVTEMATWTIERAEQAGYAPTIDPETGEYRKNKWGKPIGNEKYLTDPQAMLHAKALMEVCRKLAPSVLLGIADNDDAHLFEDGPRSVAVTQVRSPGVDELRARLAAGRSPEIAAPEPEPAEAAPEPPAEPESPKASRTQNQKLNALFERAGLTKDDKSGRQIVAAALHSAPATADGTQHIIDQLEGAAARGDDALVDTVQAIITEHDEANQ